ncbi:hypothetical protein B0H10DRAFT_1945862 [Mycena sp. CBHHK59/15]|nr:hypothetical protein B0H10DRAFT_1945862 [Mycena sp. CBHHK59/15]
MFGDVVMKAKTIVLVADNRQFVMRVVKNFEEVVAPGIIPRNEEQIWIVEGKIPRLVEKRVYGVIVDDGSFLGRGGVAYDVRRAAVYGVQLPFVGVVPVKRAIGLENGTLGASVMVREVETEIWRDFWVELAQRTGGMKVWLTEAAVSQWQQTQESTGGFWDDCRGIYTQESRGLAKAQSLLWVALRLPGIYPGIVDLGVERSPNKYPLLAAVSWVQVAQELSR